MGYIAGINRYSEKETRQMSWHDVYTTNMHRELFYAWCFLAQEGLLDEALEYMGEHMGIPTPLEQAERLCERTYINGAGM